MRRSGKRVNAVIKASPLEENRTLSGRRLTVSEPGTWYVGATPPDVDMNKPPVVFVPGLRGSADDWWGDTTYHGKNDMFERMYNNQYRTAFVELYDVSGEAADMWDNGALLAQMLEEIRRYFGEKVNIVAHSKGGVDTQTALVHDDAHHHVGRVITLGSSHWGSPLADLAHSWWAGWLAELLDMRDAGTESLQTGYMEHFRSLTDSHANVKNNPYFTAAGTDWGTFPSALWMGGSYLSAYGSNDGLVNVWSTRLPYDKHLFTKDVDHDRIRMGSASFHHIDPILHSTGGVTVESVFDETAASFERTGNQGMHQVIRGQYLPVDRRVEEEIPVESGVREVVFHLMTDHTQVKAILVSPSNKVYDGKSTEYYQTLEESEIFRGAKSQGFRVSQPEPGEWKVILDSQRVGAYLLTTTFSLTSVPEVDVIVPNSNHWETPVRVRLPKGWKSDDGGVKVRLVPTGMKGLGMMETEYSEENLKPENHTQTSFAGPLPKLTKAGMYNLTAEVQGINEKGERFARTLIRSFYVPQGEDE